MKLHLPKVPLPKWAVIALALVLFVLIVGAIKLASDSFREKNQLAYLTVVSGDVDVSDGINERAARSGAIFDQGARILVKTGRGIAHLKVRDGSYVILDSHTTIEFNRQKETTPANFFVVNLIQGRLMIVSEMKNRTPFQFLMANNIVVRGFEAVMGLEVTESGTVHAKLDCLVGVCQVNGNHFLKPGQNAQIGADNSVLITENASSDAWVSLAKASNLDFSLPNGLQRVAPTITQTPFPPAQSTLTQQASHTPGIPPTIASTSSTPGKSPTVQPTQTLTRTPVRYIPPVFTPTDEDRNPAPPATPRPSLTSVPTKSLSPSNTISPSDTPSPTEIATSTAIPMPTSTLIPTDAPTLAPSPQPTRTEKPSKTPKPTQPQPPTFTDEPTATESNTDTPEPFPTDAPPPTKTPEDDDDDDAIDNRAALQHRECVFRTTCFVTTQKIPEFKVFAGKHLEFGVLSYSLSRYGYFRTYSNAPISCELPAG